MFPFQNNNTQQANPQATPQVSQEQISYVKSLLNKKGISAETWVRQLCAQRGINVEEFMEQFRNVSLP